MPMRRVKYKRIFVFKEMEIHIFITTYFFLLYLKKNSSENILK